MIQRDGRRVLYSAERVVAMMQSAERMGRLLARAEHMSAMLRAREEFHTLAAEVDAELQNVYRQLDDQRAVLAMLIASAREKAEGELADLYRQMDAMLARLSRRDPAQPLH